MKVRSIEEAIAFRKLIESAAQSAPAEQAEVLIDLFPVWNGATFYKIGDKVSYNGKVYKCILEVAPNPSWTPDITPTIWEIMARPQEEGTYENPITAEIGLRYYKDKYYKEGDDIYLCIRQDSEDGTVLYYMPSVLVNNYFQLTN